MGELEDRFAQAAVRAKSLPAQSNDDLLRMYALYKQATVGDATGKRPGALDMKGRAKFDAWSKLRGLSRNEASQQYVAFIDQLSA